MSESSIGGTSRRVIWKGETENMKVVLKCTRKYDAGFTYSIEIILYFSV